MSSNFTLEDLQDKRIVMIGFEATNRALFHYLRVRFPALRITIADASLDVHTPNEPNIELKLGADYLDRLHEFDVIIRSPGVRYWPEIEEMRDRVVTATELFFNEVRTRTRAKIIGVTGSKGKSTTASLVYEVLRSAKKETFLVGNIDNQDWDIFNKVTDDTWIVYELSSYMLEDFKAWPDIAVMVSMFPEHLDWHGDYEKYVNAKANITRRQHEKDLFIFNAKYDELVLIADHTQAFKIPVNTEKGFHIENGDFYEGGELVMSGADVKLRGLHNKENLLSVLALAKMLNIPYQVVHDITSSFVGLPHRLELVTEKKGITFFDDSISTTPESTMAAIDAMETKIGALILGGQDRGYDYTELAKMIEDRDIATVVLLPGARNKITAALEEAGYSGERVNASSMHEAVKACFDHASKGSVALLSTGAPSYDMFKDYKDQGEQFQSEVKAF